MPIFTDEDDVALEEQATGDSLVSVQTQHDFRTNTDMDVSIVSNKDQKLEYMLSNIKGYKWSVDYFLNIATINDKKTAPDTTIPNTVQKYNRIDKLELLVQTPINQSGNIEDIQGDAIINCGFLPHVNDVFVAELTGGRSAIFLVNTVEVKTYNLRDAYFLSYSLFTFLDNNNIEKYNDLVYKTVNQFVYDKEHLLDFSAPIILSTDYKRKLNLKQELTTLTKFYCKKFIDIETNLFILPTITSKYYDSYISNFIFKIIDITQVPEIVKVSRVHDNLAKEEYSIWDVLINRDISMLSLVNKKLWYRVVINNNNPVLRSLGYIGVNFILDKVDNNTLNINPITNTLATVGQPVNQVVDDRHYVLTDKFYSKDKVNASVFEKLVINYLEGNILNVNELETYINNYETWNTENQFYCIPILMLLIKDSINNTFVRL